MISSSTLAKKLMEGDEGYNSDPTLGDKVHVLVCVVPVDTVALLSDEMVKKMKEVRMEARELGECTTMFPLLLYESKYQETISILIRFLHRQEFPNWLFSPELIKPVPRLKRTEAISTRASTWRKRYILEFLHNVIFQHICHVCSLLYDYWSTCCYFDLGWRIPPEAGHSNELHLPCEELHWGNWVKWPN